VSRKSKPKKRDPLKTKDQSRLRRQFIDYDYIKKLSPEEREFLAKFTDEYYGGGGFKRGEDGKFDYTDNVHKTDELRRDCYNKNNQNQRCIYSLAKTTNKVYELEEAITKAENSGENLQDLFNLNHEDDIIELIDSLLEEAEEGGESS